MDFILMISAYCIRFCSGLWNFGQCDCRPNVMRHRE